jgi:hypothetical protein
LVDSKFSLQRYCGESHIIFNEKWQIYMNILFNCHLKQLFVEQYEHYDLISMNYIEMMAKKNLKLSCKKFKVGKNLFNFVGNGRLFWRKRTESDVVENEGTKTKDMLIPLMKVDDPWGRWFTSAGESFEIWSSIDDEIKEILFSFEFFHKSFMINWLSQLPAPDEICLPHLYLCPNSEPLPV